MPTLSSLSQASTSYIFRPPSAFALTPATLLSVPWEAELPWRTTATHLLLLLRHSSPFFWVVSLLLPLGHQPLLHFLLYTFLSPKIIIFCRAPSLIVSANLLASLIPWSSLSIQSMAISQPSLFKTDTLSLSTTLRRLGSPDRLTVRSWSHTPSYFHSPFIPSIARSSALKQNSLSLSLLSHFTTRSARHCYLRSFLPDAGVNPYPGCSGLTFFHPSTQPAETSYQQRRDAFSLCCPSHCRAPLHNHSNFSLLYFPLFPTLPHPTFFSCLSLLPKDFRFTHSPHDNHWQ